MVQRISLVLIILTVMMSSKDLDISVFQSLISFLNVINLSDLESISRKNYRMENEAYSIY